MAVSEPRKVKIRDVKDEMLYRIYLEHLQSQSPGFSELALYSAAKTYDWPVANVRLVLDKLIVENMVRRIDDQSGDKYCITLDGVAHIENELEIDSTVSKFKTFIVSDNPIPDSDGEPIDSAPTDKNIARTDEEGNQFVSISRVEETDTAGALSARQGSDQCNPSRAGMRVTMDAEVTLASDRVVSLKNSQEKTDTFRNALDRVSEAIRQTNSSDLKYESKQFLLEDLDRFKDELKKDQTTEFILTQIIDTLRSIAITVNSEGIKSIVYSAIKAGAKLLESLGPN